MSLRNVRLALHIANLIFFLIALWSYYYGQRDTGRVFTVTAFALSAALQLGTTESKYIKILFFAMQCVTALLVFIASSNQYGK